MSLGIWPQEAITKYCTHLHHTLAAQKRDFPALLVAALPNSKQTNLPSSNHTYTKSTPKHIHHHYAPSVTSTHTRHTSSLQLHPHTHHIVTPGFVDSPRRSDCTAGQMDGEAGWWTTSGNIGLPPHWQGSGEWVDNYNIHPLYLPYLLNYCIGCYACDAISYITSSWSAGDCIPRS